jgi:hypothetical protein
MSMSGSSHTWQAFSVGHPVAASISYRRIQTPHAGGKEPKSSRSCWEQVLGDMILLREQFPCHHSWRYRALPAGTTCGGREERSRHQGDSSARSQATFSDSDMLPYPPLPAGEGVMHLARLCQDESACLLKMKGPVVTPTLQAERLESGSSILYAPPRVVADGQTAAQSLPARR